MLPPYYVSNFLGFSSLFFPPTGKLSRVSSFISLLFFFSLKFLRRPSQVLRVAPIKMQYSTTGTFPFILEPVNWKMNITRPTIYIQEENWPLKKKKRKSKRPGKKTIRTELPLLMRMRFRQLPPAIFFCFHLMCAPTHEISHSGRGK